MIDPSELSSYLERMAQENPKCVIGKIEEGQKVSKSWGLTYIIDDKDIDKKLGDYPEGAILYGPIHRALESSQKKILKIFNGESEAPFSRAFEERVGECLEKAVLMQLSTQRNGRSFLINGCIEIDGDGIGPHAYNVVIVKGEPFLIDTQNPLAKDKNGNVTHAYVAPIIGFKEKYGDFIVPDEWKQGRVYSIF